MYQEKGNAALNWIAVASITFAASLPFVSRTLNRHPYRLFAVEFLALQTNWVVWDLEQYSVVIARAFYFTSGLQAQGHDYATELTIFKCLLTSFKYQTEIAWILFALVNTILYVDLYWIIVDPFTPTSQRHTLYRTAFCAQVAFHFFIVTLSLSTAALTDDAQSQIYAVNTIVYVLASTVCLLLILKNSFSQKLSKHLQNRILLRYLLYFLVVSPQYYWKIYLMLITFGLFARRPGVEHAMSIAQALSAIAMALIRLSEPLILFTIKRRCRKLCH